MGYSRSSDRTSFAMANGYAERIFRSIRQECLDYTIVFGEAHLRLVLTAYWSCYNITRTHLSLRKDPGRNGGLRLRDDVAPAPSRAR